MTESYIKPFGNGGVALVGEDATRLFQAASIKTALGLLARGIQPTRGYTLTKGLAAATAITGKQYKRTEVEQARADLDAWIVTMRAALPVIKEDG